ncbi:Ubiquinol-cytochrome C reductase iron-sulfur subunit [hydrothermal vent metagenome]|uniref:Ubiquinol-cytochrome c reductase iron-sulfur subunit n=1 Tax=hydrothermal vent metagenome TaxID=652676 RepID=A0A3B0XM91_9ZZZZ
MNKNDKSRRRFLLAATGTIGATGLAIAAWPFIDSMNPSERAKVSGAPVIIDFSKIEPGRQITVSWRQHPVWVLNRTPEMLQRMSTSTHLERLRDPDSKVTSQQPKYAQNEYRSLHPEHLVVIGICTHLGCIPTFRPESAPKDLGADWIGGYSCPCHGSRFDFSGRVFKSVPAPTNLVIPPYRYLSEFVIEIGIDTEV